MSPSEKTKAEVSYKIHQETARQGTDKSIRVEHGGKTYEGTPHEDGAIFSDINTRDIHEVKK